MVANNDSLHESILIKRAKRRLVGAVTILIILFSLSIFFLQDRSQVKELNKNVKVSFMQMGDDEINQSPDTFFKTVKKIEEDNENIIVSEKIETTKKVYLINFIYYQSIKVAQMSLVIWLLFLEPATLCFTIVT